MLFVNIFKHFSVNENLLVFKSYCHTVSASRDTGAHVDFIPTRGNEICIYISISSGVMLSGAEFRHLTRNASKIRRRKVGNGMSLQALGVLCQ